MSVVKSKRSLSHLEFYRNAVTIRKEMIMLLLRDFGVKDKVRGTQLQLLYDTNQINDDDFFLLNDIISRNEIGVTIIDKYPDWLINSFRTNIMSLLNELTSSITIAATIYPLSNREMVERRKYQNKAIAICYSLLEEMQFIARILPIDVNKYDRYIEMLQKEVSLLKGWRNSAKFKYLSRVVEQE